MKAWRWRNDPEFRERKRALSAERWRVRYYTDGEWREKERERGRIRARLWKRRKLAAAKLEMLKALHGKACGSSEQQTQTIKGEEV